LKKILRDITVTRTLVLKTGQ